MSYQGMKHNHDNNTMGYRCNKPWWSLRHDKGVSNDGNKQDKKIKRWSQASFYETLIEKFPF